MEKAFANWFCPNFLVTGSHRFELNLTSTKKPETIDFFQGFQPFTVACVRGFELLPLSSTPHRKEASAIVFLQVTGKSQVFTASNKKTNKYQVLIFPFLIIFKFYSLYTF